MPIDHDVKTVEDYIAAFPEATQEKLNLMRETIKKHALNTVESIAYGMPAYKLNKKPLVYFGGFAKHIGFYATPSAHEKFQEELSVYKQGKGSVQFPLDQPLPIDLIIKIVKFRVQENQTK
ncbi:iron chaperone [Tamlana flava]|uniref:iron chaperone n=1 Tax=Tamlana flava TaxID=3158572 RepID=UPI00351B7D39